MKIVYFNYLYDLYEGAIGSTIKAIELMSALEKCGHEVKTFWLNKRPENNNGNYTSELRNSLKKKLDRYLHEPNQILKNMRYLYQENKIIRKEKPDLIISRLELYYFATLLLAKIRKIPWILEADSPEVYEARKYYIKYKRFPLIDQFIENLNLRYADKVLVVSNLVKDYFAKLGIAKDKIHVISNGADPEKYNPNVDKSEIVQKYGLDNCIVIGFVGSFHHWHGIQNLMAVLDTILSTRSDVKFLLVGHGGAKEAELKDIAESKNFGGKVIFSGHVSHDKVASYISAMDIVIAPYPKLDFFYYSPMKIYEYMACGKAVVASKIGQIAEVIQDMQNGVLVEPDDVGELSEKILQLLDNKELRDSLGARAWESFFSNHTWEVKAQEVSRVCESVTASK